MLEDDRLPIDSRKFGFVRYSTPGDAPEVDVDESALEGATLDVTVGWMLEDGKFVLTPSRKTGVGFVLALLLGTACDDVLIEDELLVGTEP